MHLEPQILDANLHRHREVCGTPLTDAEIEAAREAEGPFLCSVHVAEELPAIVLDDEPSSLDSEKAVTVLRCGLGE
jgi:hypothetical protein